MTRFLKNFLAAGILLTLAPGLRAHPGHGLLEEGLAHLLSSPFHIVSFVILGLALFAAGQWAKRRQRLLRLSGATALLAAGALWAAAG